MSWFLYVVECNARGKPLYTGISTNVEQRVKTHNAGKGAKYVKGKLPVVLVATWEYPDKSTALRAEIAFKSLSRLAKQIYVQSPDQWDWENPKRRRVQADAEEAGMERVMAKTRIVSSKELTSRSLRAEDYVDRETACWGCGKWSSTIYCQGCADAGKAKCPHDKEVTDCNDCMVEGDLAHDARREG